MAGLAFSAHGIDNGPEQFAQAAPGVATDDVRYRVPRIVRPKNAETIHDNTGAVLVEVSLRPALAVRAGHRLRVLLDDAMRPEEWTAAHFSLQEVDRGTHTLQVIVVDGDGNRLAVSAPVEFHMWRASRLFPARRDPR